MGVRMEVVYNNPQKRYYPGETVSGKLIVTSDESITLRSISIKFQGKAKTYWKEDDDNYGAVQKLFSSKIMLYGGQGYNETLQPGEFCYPFSMLLPQNMPSSFKCITGHVHYKVKAKIDRPQWRDPHVDALFDVICPVNLNLNGEYRMAQTNDTHKYFCCLCCRSGPLTLVSKIARRGYVPGDIIHLTVEVDNASSTAIVMVTCALLRVVTCYTVKRKKFIKTPESILKDQLEGSVSQNNSRTWGHKIQIPQVSPPSYVENCEIIDLDYVVQVRARPAGAHLDLVNDLPIVIGTTPITEDTVYSQDPIFSQDTIFSQAPVFSEGSLFS